MQCPVEHHWHRFRFDYHAVPRAVMGDAMWLRIGILPCLVLMLLGTTHARAEKRIALVIGNSQYRSAPQLSNPVPDATAIADLLKGAGFDSVQLKLDLDIVQLRRAVSDFADLAASSDIAVVYYAGHGMEIDGVNYLIPVDAKLVRDFDVEDEALSLERVLRVIEPARHLRLVILDACRENPFLKTMKRSIAARAVGRGLARVEPTTSDTLIAFAAKAGSVALDGAGANSPFTTALLKHIATPGLDLRIAFGQVRDDVLSMTQHGQEPFVYGSLGGDVVSLVNAATTPAPGAPEARAPVDDPAQAWTVAKDSSDKAVLEAFIRRYGNSFFADLARARVRDLEARRTNDDQSKSRVAVAPSNPPSDLPATAPSAGPAAFDGEWSITGRGGPGCPLKSWQGMMTIKGNGLRTGRGGAGHISADGRFEYSQPGALRPGLMVSYFGQLGNNEGSGIYWARACRGSMALKRNP
jgi:hypothetical protein